LCCFMYFLAMSKRVRSENYSECPRGVALGRGGHEVYDYGFLWLQDSEVA